MRYIDKLNSSSDTLIVNDCKRYIEELEFLEYEMAFSSAGNANYFSCKYKFSIAEGLIKLDNKNKSIAYLRGKTAVNGFWKINNYTAHSY